MLIIFIGFVGQIDTEFNQFYPYPKALKLESESFPGHAHRLLVMEIVDHIFTSLGIYPNLGTIQKIKRVQPDPRDWARRIIGNARPRLQISRNGSYACLWRGILKSRESRGGNSGCR